MGMWDGVRSIASKAWYWNSTPDLPSDSNGGVPYFNNLPEAVAKIGNIVGTKKLEEYVPNPEQRDKVRRIVSGLSKLAIDTAVNESLKGITGGIQVYKIVKEGLQDQSPLQPTNGNKKTEHSVMEDMQVKIERLQEELNFIKQQNEASIQCAKELDLTKEASGSGRMLLWWHKAKCEQAKINRMKDDNHGSETHTGGSLSQSETLGCMDKYRDVAREEALSQGIIQADSPNSAIPFNPKAYVAVASEGRKKKGGRVLGFGDNSYSFLGLPVSQLSRASDCSTARSPPHPSPEVVAQQEIIDRLSKQLEEHEERSPRSEEQSWRHEEQLYKQLEEQEERSRRHEERLNYVLTMFQNQQQQQQPFGSATDSPSQFLNSSGHGSGK